MSAFNVSNQRARTNRDNIKDAIAVMQRVIDNRRAFNMRAWQADLRGLFGDLCTSEESYQCGTVACFAGYLAMSPEFQKAGGSVGPNGMPVFSVRDVDRVVGGAEAVAAYLDIPPGVAHCICGVRGYATLPTDQERYRYAIPLDEVTPEMVIKKLKLLLEDRSL